MAPGRPPFSASGGGSLLSLATRGDALEGDGRSAQLARGTDAVAPVSALFPAPGTWYVARAP